MRLPQTALLAVAIAVGVAVVITAPCCEPVPIE